MPHLQVPGARLYYQSYGSGPALVFSHGGGENGLRWWRQVPFFAERYQVITFDHRGHGQSPCDPGCLTVAGIGTDIAAILDHAGVARAALVGESMGGVAAMLFACAYPERAAALVLSSSTGGIATPGMGENLRRLSRLTHGDIRGLQPPELQFLHRQLNALGAVPDGNDILAQLSRIKVDPAPVQQAEIPIQILSGDEDDILPTALARELLRILPQAEFHKLHGVGHLLLLESPAVANRLITEFLARVATQRGGSW